MTGTKMLQVKRNDNVMYNSEHFQVLEIRPSVKGMVATLQRSLKIVHDVPIGCLSPMIVKGDLIVKTEYLTPCHIVSIKGERVVIRSVINKNHVYEVHRDELIIVAESMDEYKEFQDSQAVANELFTAVEQRLEKERNQIVDAAKDLVEVIAEYYEKYQMMLPENYKSTTPFRDSNGVACSPRMVKAIRMFATAITK